MYSLYPCYKKPPVEANSKFSKHCDRDGYKPCPKRLFNVTGLKITVWLKQEPLIESLFYGFEQYGLRNSKRLLQAQWRHTFMGQLAFWSP